MKIYVRRPKERAIGETTTVIYFEDSVYSDGDPWEDVLFVRIHHCVKTRHVGSVTGFFGFAASVW